MDLYVGIGIIIMLLLCALLPIQDEQNCATYIYYSICVIAAVGFGWLFLE